MVLRWRITALALLFLCAGASAEVALRSLDTTVAVQNDGSAIVVERFSPLVRGNVVWKAQNAFPGAFGMRKARTIEIIDVSDGDGQKLPYTSSDAGDFLELSIVAGGASEIKVSYSVLPQVRFLRDRDELVWRAGEHWAGSVQRSSILVQLPDPVAEQFHAQGSYIGESGLKIVPAVETNNSVQVECAVRLVPGNPCTVDIIFPTGLLAEASAWKQAAASLSVNPIFVLPIVVLALIVGIQLYRIRRVDPTYAPQYEPPDGLTPAEVGVIIDDKLDPRDVVATIVDLAVRGYVRMEECVPDEGVTFEGQDYILRSIRPKESWKALAPHERTALFHIFYGGEWTKLSSLYQRFYSIVPIIREEVFALLRQKGLYRFDPDFLATLQLPQWAGQAFVVGAYLCILLFASSKNSVVIVAAALVVSVVITLLWLKAFSPKSALGKRAYAHVRGFQEFMNSVERDHLERVPSEKFQSWLPYAMALGVEHHWTEAFSGIAIPRPEWYESSEAKDQQADVLGFLVQTFAHNAYRSLLARPRGGMFRSASKTETPLSVPARVRGASQL
jgi:Predicted membrane protein (DUF2207)